MATTTGAVRINSKTFLLDPIQRRNRAKKCDLQIHASRPFARSGDKGGIVRQPHSGRLGPVPAARVNLICKSAVVRRQAERLSPSERVPTDA